jgi:hypothetical protein
MAASSNKPVMHVSAQWLRVFHEHLQGYIETVELATV